MQDDKITILIDDRPYRVSPNQNLVEAIRETGQFIPSLCYYEHIDPPLGTCRVCTVMVNGRPAASCTERVKDGMEIKLNTPELVDLRKGVVEMMFAEGNHFCPACEKSGDCDLQGLSYRLGISASRFPHLFVNRLIDYRPKRIVIEHNRCIRCRRCVEEVHTDDGHPVFAFAQRGNLTTVDIDYDQEAKLTEEQALHAMHICPTGSILVRGKSLARPRGERKYDHTDVKGIFSMPSSLQHDIEKGEKKIIATTSLAGCFGCHMSMLDIDEEIIDLIELVEIDKSPLTDKKRFDRRCHVGIIEGGCCNTHNVEVLKDFRQNCDILVAVGECAIWGGLPAMRNFIPLEECLEESYCNTATIDSGQKIIPKHPDLPQILDRVYACNELEDIDYYIPGCPPDASHIWKMIKHILFGEAFTITQDEFKYD
jgi:coenzyme F420-reducing hydrogenase gamma subunit/aerobic-type carbon monoxide dehydrogenase small subunit (CoxS/CutS family)/ferredoxin